MARCSFCKDLIEAGTGKMLIMKDARVHYFCSRKCEKNQMQLGRTARKLKWTHTFEIEKKAAKKSEAKHSKEHKAEGTVNKDHKEEKKQ